ncbi:S-adenosyl-L-methionine-dependent methyltransferase [Aspergillus floccosus]
MSSSSFKDEIVSLAKTARLARECLDENARVQALSAARELVQTLSSPPETAIQDVSLLGAFRAIRDKSQGITTQEIAAKCGASPSVLSQVLKVLVATGYVREAGVQLYTPSALTMVMADPVMEATTRATFDIGHACVTYAPEFFRRNDNQAPTSIEDTPFQLSKNTKLSYFSWLGENPSLAKDFQQFMSIKQQRTPSWVDWFDVDRVLLAGLNPTDETVLFVDVAGGEGRYTQAFNRKCPPSRTPGRRILQDLPHVFSYLANPPDATELMAHDFFTPQPIKGARVYYLHWVLHDWADERAREILRHIVEAMEPGYSRLVINENIIPDQGCDYASACLSLLMMVQVGALERTEQQWRELLNSVGLTELAFYQPPGEGEGVIVATK